MKSPTRCSLFVFVLSAAFLAAPGQSRAAMLGPTAYLQTSDSPFAGLSFNWFYLEDFEDGLQNTPGASMPGIVLGPGEYTDSVDGDDGVLDGFGRGGHSLFLNNAMGGIQVNFYAILGNFPTHAGLVWTDGLDRIDFEAFDGAGQSIGIVSSFNADGFFTGQTPEDRFFGAMDAGGISAIRIRSSLPNFGGGIEIDHVQYGFSPVPEPGTLAALALGGMALARRRRR